MNLDLLNNKFKQLNILEDKINYEFKPFKNKLIYKKINNSNNKNLTYENYSNKKIKNKNNNKINRHLYFKDIEKEFINEITCFGFSPFIRKEYKEQKENFDIKKYNLNFYNKGFYNYIKKKFNKNSIQFKDNDIENKNNNNFKHFNIYNNKNYSEEKKLKNFNQKKIEDEKIPKNKSNRNENLIINISNNQKENSYENIKISSHSITNEGEGEVIKKIFVEKPKVNINKILHKKKLKINKTKKLKLNIDNNFNKISNSNNESLTNNKENKNKSKKILFNQIYNLRNNLHPLTSITNKNFFFNFNNYNSPKNNTLYKNFFMNNYNNSAKNIFNKNNKINIIKCFDFFIDEKYKIKNIQDKISKSSRKEKRTNNNNKLYNKNSINNNKVKFYSCKNILNFKNKKKLQMDTIFNSAENIFNKNKIEKCSTIVFKKY